MYDLETIIRLNKTPVESIRRIVANSAPVLSPPLVEASAKAALAIRAEQNAAIRASRIERA